MAEHSLWARELNGEADEDEALRIAIAMSLGENGSQSHTIDLTQEDDVETASEASNESSNALQDDNRRVPSGPAHRARAPYPHRVALAYLASTGEKWKRSVWPDLGRGKLMKHR